MKRRGLEGIARREGIEGWMYEKEAVSSCFSLLGVISRLIV